MTDHLKCSYDVQILTSSQTNVASFHVPKSSQKCSSVQLHYSLTPTHPCFFVEVKSKGSSSDISVGIAASDIGDGIHAGSWCGSVGYRAHSGHCVSSHTHSANTEGSPYGSGDTVGVMVTHFGAVTCTVVFLKNSKPVATRYLFKPKANEIFPTIGLENGPVTINITWPNQVKDVPSLTMVNPSHWIKPEGLLVLADGTVSVPKRTSHSLIMQTAVSLGTGSCEFEVMVKQSAVQGTGVTGTMVGMATCSPLHPTPTCPLLHDFLHWSPDNQDGPCVAGTRLSWGIHYNPRDRSKADFNDKLDQLVLCYIAINTKIVWARVQLQPEGGYYPIISPNTAGGQALVINANSQPRVNVDKLDVLYVELLEDARKAVATDVLARGLTMSSFRKSPGVSMSVEPHTSVMVVSPLSREPQTVQCTIPLSHTRSCFYVEITKLSAASDVCIGISGLDAPLHSLPGKLTAESVGWSSLDGGLYSDQDIKGSTDGQRFREGDMVGVCVTHFNKHRSVVLFIKNGRPLGTRLLRHSTYDHLLATVTVMSNRKEVILDVAWHTRVGGAPKFNMMNVEHWCVPEGSSISSDGVIHLSQSQDIRAIQAPCPLHSGWNHYEIRLLDKFTTDRPPPAIALTNAGHLDTSQSCSFKQNYIRFWPVGNAASAVNVGDRIGWGLYYPDVAPTSEGHLVICYLTVNTAVALMRVLVEPLGGFYPVIVVPSNVHRVKLEFGATYITQHPFTTAIVTSLVSEANSLLTTDTGPPKPATNNNDLMYPVTEFNNNNVVTECKRPPNQISISDGHNTGVSSCGRSERTITGNTPSSGINDSINGTKKTLSNVIPSNAAAVTIIPSNANAYHSQSSPDLRPDEANSPCDSVSGSDASPPFVQTNQEGFKKFKDSYAVSVSTEKNRPRSKGQKRSHSMTALDSVSNQVASKSCVIL